MTQEEQNALLEKLEQWDEAAPSIESSRRGSTATQNFPTVLSDRSEQTSSEFDRQKEFSTTAHDELERITELPEYTTLLSAQATQRDRFLHWTAAQRMSLTESHSDQRKNILTTHESAAEDLAEHHADALAEAEDKQIVAEAALREVHLIEKFSAETCLRHREAYCSGMLSNGEAHGRNITDVDLERLEIARREKEMIQGRHFSAINVLRGEQSRRIKLRKQRQERELQELARQQRREELEFERKCSAEVSKLEGGLAEKKRKLEWRWELQMALLAKKLWQAEGGMEENFRLPTAKWTASEPGRLVSASAELIVDEAIEMESQVAAREFKVG
ncbi:unnamed protein product [Zymoseptoria tritici ST99CH_3D7]|uniref:Uncharacterized protein n=1 Tax=Zymoseptoria tritici (strain ST99CH_3D7) TaxID=1276538 RepID=A0A1X7S981_ZYMT9|nr:unnamed protein product [Zymoseptoria tritici ST99CH_3D7]